MAQLILMGHAAWANGERSKARTKSKDVGEDDPEVSVGSTSKKLSEMNSEDYAKYYQF